MVLNEEQWIKELREKRIAYGISQGRLAVASGITREYLNKIENVLGEIPPAFFHYIDCEAYGRDIEIQDYFVKTRYGMCEIKR